MAATAIAILFIGSPSMRIYLDNNATTALHPDVLSVLEENLRTVFGNASSIHEEGQTARQVIEEAREAVAHLIGAPARDVVFTSGGTESNNAAIFGAVSSPDIHHIVTTAIEHPSVSAPVDELLRRGHAVTIVSPGPSGRVEADTIIAAIRSDTRLVTLMLANNETGVVQPVAEVGRVCRARGIHFHCDAVQGAGKIDIDTEALSVDTLSLSAHKIHGPKGVGALYVRRGTAMHPLVFGGAQERRRRAGTENVPLAAAFGVAAGLAAGREFKESIAALRGRFEHLVAGLGVTINGQSEPRVPNTSSVRFEGADAEGIVIALDLEGVAASTGSACSSGRVEPSRALLAMGLSPRQARETVRFSLSRFTTSQEIETVAAILQGVIPRAAF